MYYDVCSLKAVLNIWDIMVEGILLFVKMSDWNK